jgi:hypothetical protein
VHWTISATWLIGEAFQQVFNGSEFDAPPGIDDRGIESLPPDGDRTWRPPHSVSPNCSREAVLPWRFLVPLVSRPGRAPPTGTTVMNEATVERTSLRLSAALLLVGQLSYIVVTLFHTGGEANDHHAIFAAYAASGMWTAVHVAQFACMATFLAGLFALSFALDVQAGTTRWTARFGAASVAVALALYGGVLAVDGVALKQAVNAWASAPEAEKAARFASAETIRWLEWGMRSYANFALGLALLLFAMAVGRTAAIQRPIACLMGLSGLTYLAQGWIAGAAGFSETHTLAILLAEALNLAWMIWLLVVAWRIHDSTAPFPAR